MPQALNRPLLALDASGPSCSVAVFTEGDAPLTRFEAMARGQAERLVPMLGEALDAAAVRPMDLVGIACTVGPGSFTGIRIALAAAEGLALATGARLVGICSLQALAEAQPDGPGPLVIAVDTGRGDLACLCPGLWDAPILLAPDIAADLLAAKEILPPRLAGSGAALLAAALARLTPPYKAVPAGGPDLVHADSVGRLALARRALLSASPVYLRPPNTTPPRAGTPGR